MPPTNNCLGIGRPRHRVVKSLVEGKALWTAQLTILKYVGDKDVVLRRVFAKRHPLSIGRNADLHGYSVPRRKPHRFAGWLRRSGVYTNPPEICVLVVGARLAARIH